MDALVNTFRTAWKGTVFSYVDSMRLLGNPIASPGLRSRERIFSYFFGLGLLQETNQSLVHCLGTCYASLALSCALILAAQASTAQLFRSSSCLLCLLQSHRT